MRLRPAYRASSRTAGATQRYPVLKNHKNKTIEGAEELSSYCSKFPVESQVKDLREYGLGVVLLFISTCKTFSDFLLGPVICFGFQNKKKDEGNKGKCEKEHSQNIIFHSSGSRTKAVFKCNLLGFHPFSLVLKSWFSFLLLLFSFRRTCHRKKKTK